jgi:hypothetical protein
MSWVIRIKEKYFKEKFFILSIFIVGLLLRLAGSLKVGLVFDELAWLREAEKISFSPESFNLLLHGVLHPPFEAYLVKFSTLLFPAKFFSFIPEPQLTMISTRFLHVLLSSATIPLIYILVKKGLNRMSGVFAASILALSQFHIHFSRTVIQTAPLLFFAALSLLFFWESFHKSKDKFIILTGISLGFTYLCEETALFLFIIFFIFLILTKKIGLWLKKRETYFAILAFIVIVSPDVYWNLTVPSSDMKFHITRALVFNGISFLPAILYIGEVLLFFVKDIETFIGGLGREMIWSLEYPTMHWILGVFSLGAVGYSFSLRRNYFIKLMLVMFFVIFVFFLFFASKGPFSNFNHWWTALSFIPAVVLASNVLSKIYKKGSSFKWIPAALVIYLFFHSLSFLAISDQVYIRRPSFLSKLYLKYARTFFLKGDYFWAEENLRKVLKYDPESVPAKLNLAECYKRTGQDDLANLYLNSDTLLMAPHAEKKFLFDRGYLKYWFVSGFINPSETGKDEFSCNPEIDSAQSMEMGYKNESLEYKRIGSLSAFIDLKELLDNPANTFSYLYTQIYSPRALKARLLVGCDDGLVICLNGEKVYEVFEKFFWFPDEDAVEVTLKQGRNDLVLKALYSGGEYFGFTIRFMDQDGEFLIFPDAQSTEQH